jgi:transcriptional regulator with XRE-family HTH domain
MLTPLSKYVERPRTIPSGVLINRWRFKRLLTRRRLAKKTGVTTQYIKMIELGKRSPSPELLRIIARVLEVPVHELKKSPSRTRDI